jgi:hypothetical protein
MIKKPRVVLVLALLGLGLLGSCGALIGLGISVLFKASAAVKTPVEQFFVAVKDGDFARARRQLSRECRAKVGEAELRAFFSRSALAGYRDFSWNRWSIGGREADLEGVVRLEDGGTVPMHVWLVKEADGWKVYAFRKPSSGLVEDDDSDGLGTPPPPPSREEKADKPGFLRED